VRRDGNSHLPHGARAGLLSLLSIVVRSSTLHVGGIAAIAALRTDLVEHGHLSEHDFNQCFGVARMTPGTNFLAFYTAVGYRVASWRGAALALSAATAVPAAIVLVLVSLYVNFASEPLVARAMNGARAGAWAVLLWAIVRLFRPVLIENRLRGAALAAAVLGVALIGYVPAFFILLGGGAIGAVLFRRR
jgi:chromate transporter